MLQLVQMEMLLEIQIKRADKDDVKTKPNVLSLCCYLLTQGTGSLEAFSLIFSILRGLRKGEKEGK